MTYSAVSETKVSSAAPGTIREIEKLSSTELPYERFLREYVVPNKPVVIKDATPGWSALREWTPEFFKSCFGSRMVEVTYGKSMLLGDLIDAVLASSVEHPGPYLHKVIIHQHMPELLASLAPENVYAFPRRYCSPLMPKRFQRPDGYLKLLIGGVGGKFPLIHYDSDNANAMITEIYGDKQFVLIAPEESDFVYPHPNSRHTSQIDNLENPDTEKFPLFLKATQFRTVLKPGEMIFVPSRWWHSARVVTTSISVCTNMIHGSGWKGFVDESCEVNGGVNARKMAKRMYLNTAGAVMSAAESLQQWFPESLISRRISYLSPVLPAKAGYGERAARVSGTDARPY